MDITRDRATNIFMNFLRMEWIGKNMFGFGGVVYDCTKFSTERNHVLSTEQSVLYCTTLEMKFCEDISWISHVITEIEGLGYGSELLYIPNLGYRLQFYKDGISVVKTYWFKTKLKCMWNSVAEFIIDYNKGLAV